MTQLSCQRLLIMKPNGPAVCFSKSNPTTASGQSPGTLRQRGRKAVTVQGGFGAVFGIQVQILSEAGRVAVQVISEPGSCHGAGL